MTVVEGQPLVVAEPEVHTEVETEPAVKIPVTVDGVTLEVTQDELTKGYMRQADYTRKTQALSAERAEVARGLQIQRALETNPEATLRYLANEYSVEVDAFDGDDDSEDEPVSPRLAELEQQLRQLQDAEASRAVDREITDLKTKYQVTDGQLNDVMAHATRTRQSLSSAYRELFFDEAIEALLATRSRTQAEQQIIEEKRGGAAAAVHTGGSGSGKPKVERPNNFREAYLLAQQGITYEP